MSHRRQNAGNKKSGARRTENNRIYAYPLPLLFAPPAAAPHRLLAFLGLAAPAQLQRPPSSATFDAPSRSVWVTDPAAAQRLWRRGFFGKGALSRSEPSWLARQLARREGGLTAELMRDRRRADRQQFKLDRARAMAHVAEEAERAFEEGRDYDLETAKAAIPSGATWKPQHAPTAATAEGEVVLDDDDEPPEDLEHLQLTLPEAFFLAWGLDCLTIIDPATDEPMSLQTLWTACHASHLPLSPSPAPDLRPDNPFLLHYVFYHHYRSLGWVVKSGTKFCVDYLLYKRGPVFHHAEFALVLCPTYEDPADRLTSPFALENVTPCSWTWLSTINRVNSTVHKTLILVYITIPALSRLPPDILRSPACLPHYSIREVTIRRFIPARMRD